MTDEQRRLIKYHQDLATRWGTLRVEAQKRAAWHIEQGKRISHGEPMQNSRRVEMVEAVRVTDE